MHFRPVGKLRNFKVLLNLLHLKYTRKYSACVFSSRVPTKIEDMDAPLVESCTTHDDAYVTVTRLTKFYYAFLSGTLRCTSTSF